MFTGIVERVGIVAGAQRTGDGLQLELETGFTDLSLGESVSVNGVCLTVAAFETGSNSAGRTLFHLSGETLACTAFGRIQKGAAVNLERAMPAQGRFSGHWVQGHVDGLGVVEAMTPRPDGSVDLKIGLPPSLLRYCVKKGSLCVHGISLTVNDVHDTGVTIRIIPHTWEHTTLCRMAKGEPVHIEADVIAKYVEKMLGARHE